MDHARTLLALQGYIRNIVPGDIFVAACDAGYLHLVTPSSALATRIKYNQRKIIAQLRAKTGGHIERISVSVRPELTKPEVPTSPAADPLSPDNARLMASAAQYIEDEGLRKALLRLAGHTSGSDSP